MIYGNLTARAMMDAVNVKLNEGTGAAKIKVYSGSVPADNDVALTGQTLLALLVCTDPFSGAASDANPGGRLTASAISPDASADAAGTPTFARITDSDDESHVQLTAGVGSGELNFDSATTAGAQVSISSLTLTQPEG